MFHSSTHAPLSTQYFSFNALRFTETLQMTIALTAPSAMLTWRLYQKQSYSPGGLITRPYPTRPPSLRRSPTIYCGLPPTAPRTSFLRQSRSEVSTSVYSLIARPTHKSWPLHYDWKPEGKKKGYIVERHTSVHDMISWSNDIINVWVWNEVSFEWWR